MADEYSFSIIQLCFYVGMGYSFLSRQRHLVDKARSKKESQAIQKHIHLHIYLLPFKLPTASTYLSTNIVRGLTKFLSYPFNGQ